MNYFIRMVVYTCLCTWLTIGSGYGQCGKQVFNPETGLLDCTGVTGSGGGVGGASMLTTTGAVPFVTSSGTLGQDAGFVYTSPVLKLSRASIGQLLTLNAGGPTTTSTDIFVLSADNYPYMQFVNTASGAATSDGFKIGLEASSVVLGLKENWPIDIYTSNTVRGRITGAGSWGIGTSNTAPTGTLSVVDRTTTTGATLEQIGTDGTNTSATTTRQVIRAGQAQSTTKLTEWQANAGGVIAAVGPGGGFITAATAAETLANSQCTFHLASNTQLTFTCKGSDGTLRTNTLTLI